MTVAERGEVYTYQDKIIGMLSKTTEPLWFHVEVFVLFFYWLWLLVTYWRARHNGEAAGKD